jgi:alkyldihydroxyacetonephosphate synthase
MAHPARRRVSVLSRHLTSASPAAGTAPAAAAAPAARRDASKDHLKARGWGHTDTEFYIRDEDGKLAISGTRFPQAFPAGVARTFPKARDWMEGRLQINLDDTSFARDALPAVDPPVRHDAFMAALGAQSAAGAASPVGAWFQDDECRLRHGHGATVQEIWDLRYAERFGRVPDVVCYPGSHAEVENLVRLCVAHDCVVIPFGGGTTVSGAVECPHGEARLIVSLDTARMDRILWINRENMTACIQAGCIGTDIERKLAKFGLTMGHEPDSYEFSTMGGWVATRASGMKKNTYGNIEDIVINFKVVTAVGTLDGAAGGHFPRVSAGPDLRQVILGSEGTLGVVTEAVVRLQPLPEVTTYGSVVFHDFASGVQFMREVARRRCQPASVRLVDNDQFRLAQVLKTESANPVRDQYVSDLTKFYVLKVKGFDEERMCAATLLFTGPDKANVRAQEKAVYDCAYKYGGMKGDAKNGIRGYFLTYMIAYLRDVAINYKFMAESFETSVPWDRVPQVCAAVKRRIYAEAERHGVPGEPLVSCRVTQTYDVGAAVYVYFGFLFRGLADPPRVFTEIEGAARDTIVEMGGSISHHHGVGKHRKRWLAQHHGPTGMAVLKGLKAVMDPKNTFNNGNLMT